MTGLAAIDSVWWWASLSLLIPIVIHLISRSKHKRLRFSTLAFFPKKTPLNHQQIKLTQRRLLALRLLLLLAIIFTLAHAIKDEQSNQSQVFHLLSDNWLKHAAPEKREALIALLQDTSNTHTAVNLQSNKVILPEQLRELKNTSAIQYTNTWQNVAKWQQLHPSEASQIIVHSTDKLVEFIGEKFRLLPDTQWDIAITNSPIEMTNSIELSVIVLQASNALEATLQTQKKSVLAALQAFNQLPKVNIQKYQYPNQTIGDILDSLSQQMPIAILQIGDEQTQAIAQIMTVLPSANLINISELGTVERYDFPIILANTLFDQAINQAFWQNATLSQKAITDNTTGMNIRDLTDNKNYFQSMHSEPADLPVWLVVLCVILFACERLYSERSTKQSKITSSQKVSANNV